MTTNNDDFFVGYFKMSTRTSRFVITIAVVAIVLGVGLGLVAALTQKNPGPGLKPHRSDQAFTGLVFAKPYPHMRYVDSEDAMRTLLFSSFGKSGIAPPDGREGTLLEAKGTLLERDRGQILAGPSFQPVGEPDTSLLERLENATDENLGTQRLVGEIVDSKCYFGAMRPGGGRGHRACAQMCVEGGIPPVLVLRAEDGTETHVLLCSKDEEPVNQEVLPFIAEPVAIEGELVRRAGMLLLKFDPNIITRL